ncbi:hypothetical protein KAI12_05155, partial [Candidatus Bathyarchaeota archaeon]|nr:hypothetical protein [Candidatus Bathyarchaeota archaeon]
KTSLNIETNLPKNIGEFVSSIVFPESTSAPKRPSGLLRHQKHSPQQIENFLSFLHTTVLDTLKDTELALKSSTPIL